MTSPLEARVSRAREVAEQYAAQASQAQRPFTREQLLGIFQELQPTGYLGSVLEPAVGGDALTPAAFAQIVEAITPSLPFLGNHSVPRYLATAGTRSQQTEWMPALLSGTAIGAIAITENGAGADVRSIATAATWMGGHWVLHGTKTWVTHGSVADVIIVTARTDDGLGRFLVRPSQSGVDLEPIIPTGLRYLDFSRLKLDGVIVGEEDALGSPGNGLRDTLSAFPIARSLVAVQACALADAALQAAIRALDAKQRFGQRLTEKQLVQSGIGQSWARCQAARSLAYESLRGFAQDPDGARRRSAAAKALATEGAAEIGQLLLGLLGADGLIEGNEVAHRLADIRMLTVADGPAPINWLVLGRELTGRSAF